MSEAPVTGYYRYTDIWFDWAARLPNPEDGAALKAILAHDAIVHPEHPLHVEGVNGVQLYIGTLETGEARLLFSSKQVDYIRYWLHAMGMTPHTIPLPYSDCLLLKSELRTITPINYENGGALRRAVKDIERNNKRLKGLNPTLESKRANFEKIRALWSEKKGAWISADFEAWEMDHTLLTEFGYSLVMFKDGERVEKQEHFIVHEARGYINSKYVPDWRDKYQFGESTTLTRKEFKQRIESLLENLQRSGPVYIIMHDNNQDLKYFREVLRIPLENLTHLIPETAPESGLIAIDTSDQMGALLGEDSGRRTGLEKTCRLLGIDTPFLHNAGNDAYFTLQALIKMAEGGQVDKQREERWPNQTTGSSLRVQVKPNEDDSDYESDDDGAAVGPVLGYDPKTGRLYRTDVDEDTEQVSIS
ncbi:hypothetical protein NMY22_g17250 [Coprinellus aureogranulatus]|nr:hypothetical protein NMY22_g17250 [Coprinellus aureogranulatus]